MEGARKSVQLHNIGSIWVTALRTQISLEGLHYGASLGRVSINIGQQYAAGGIYSSWKYQQY